MLSLDDVEWLCANIERLAKRVIEDASPAAADELVAECRLVDARLGADPKYGNVATRIGGVREAASSYGRPNVTLADAKDRMQRALSGMRLALVEHRSGGGEKPAR